MLQLQELRILYIFIIKIIKVMRLYFKITTPEPVERMSKYIGLWPIPAILGVIYEFDSKTKNFTVLDGIANESLIMHIKTLSDAENFIKTANEKRLARFNEGKTEYSMIDFGLWKSIFTVEDLNKAQNSVGHMLIELALEASRVCHTEVGGIERIKLLSYKLSMGYGFGGRPLDDDDVNLSVFRPMALVLSYGAKKYERNNWKRDIDDICHIVDSLLRHIIALQRGKLLDEESDLHHIGHIMCNVMFLEYHLLKT